MRLASFSLLRLVFLGMLFAGSVSAQISVGTIVNVSKRSNNESEPAIAIDPNNTNRLFISANTNATGLLSSRSSNGGGGWTATTIATGSDSLVAGCCDSSAVFDSFGNLWLVYLGEDGKVKVALSTDGGQNFSNFASLGDGDEPTIAAATGRIWVTYTDGSNTISVRSAAVTGLGTAGSFGARQVATSSTDGEYGDIAIGPNGEVLVAYQTPSSGQGPVDLYVDLDPDGAGATGFKNRVHVTSTAVGGFDAIPAQSGRTVDAEVGLAWDHSGGLFNNRVYLVYTDEAPNESNNTKILLRYSDDRGSTWSEPIRVSDDVTSHSQFLPRIALDQTTGDVAVSFYDCRNDIGTGPDDTNGIANDDAELFVAVSSDGGNTFSSNVRVTSHPSNAVIAGNKFGFGDYEGLVFEDGSFFPVWADDSNSTSDNPNGTLSKFDIYTAKIQDNSGGPYIALLPQGAADGVKNLDYDQTITAKGGTAPYVFGHTGTLPDGLSLNCSSNICVLSGNPTASGTFAFTVNVTDADANTGSRDYSVHIASNCIFCDDFENGILDSAWTYQRTWTESAGFLNATTGKKKATALAPSGANCTNCDMEATVKTTGGNSAKTWILGWYQSDNNKIELTMDDKNDQWTLEQTVNGSVIAKQVVISGIHPNTVYDVKMNFSGSTITLRVDGSTFMVLPLPNSPFGTAGLRIKKTSSSLGFLSIE